MVIFSLIPLSSPSCAPDIKTIVENTQLKNNGFLFSIEKNGKKSYLLGSIHAGFSDQQILGENIAKHAGGSDKIYVEADISDVSRSDRAIEKNGFYSDEKKLSNAIDGESYILYKSIFVERANFFTSDQYDAARPWLLVMLLPITDPLRELFPLLKFGSEAQLISLTKKNNISLAELEGIEAQTEMFARMGVEDERAYFSSYINLVKNKIIYKRFSEEVSAWTKGDFSALEKIMTDLSNLTDSYSTFYLREVINRRNLNFSKNISFLAEKNNNQFFSIGCEHLPGSAGVIKQLSDAGFKVKQIFE